jgi:hypothetical protein
MKMKALEMEGFNDRIYNRKKDLEWKVWWE